MRIKNKVINTKFEIKKSKSLKKFKIQMTEIQNIIVLKVLVI
ncbi:hypothetical protein Cabys_3427 [Caldithrix abyssi DSM 13497]|uniref:Uncharacterized protein n=1 Tax=Caldithrix abyssi DSM 13497 TaxID=880073 RepID=A0A1J1CBV4_CALAY|nr:hypothetical protein Cabys_3427 [Caldithrix abyssi DSM 13497]